MTPKTLTEWVACIEDEVMFVNVKPYSHNIINIALGAIAHEYGDEAVNQVIGDLDLERLGWSKKL